MNKNLPVAKASGIVASQRILREAIAEAVVEKEDEEKVVALPESVLFDNKSKPKDEEKETASPAKKESTHGKK
jgi:hypothetical protein